MSSGADPVPAMCIWTLSLPPRLSSIIPCQQSTPCRRRRWPPSLAFRRHTDSVRSTYSSSYSWRPCLSGGGSQRLEWNNLRRHTDLLRRSRCFAWNRRRCFSSRASINIVTRLMTVLPNLCAQISAAHQQRMDFDPGYDLKLPTPSDFYTLSRRL